MIGANYQLTIVPIEAVVSLACFHFFDTRWHSFLPTLSISQRDTLNHEFRRRTELCIVSNTDFCGELN
jgi:hypothetical protein